MLSEQLEARGLTDPAVLRAMRTVPRHAFMHEENAGQAYADHPVPLREGQTVSQPFVVASMTAFLDLNPQDRVLEIGTGSGYQAAILAELVATVCSVESRAPLHEEAKARLSRLGYSRIALRLGDGAEGWPEQAPFDAILVTCAAPEVSPSWLEQLAEGGRLVAPIGPPDAQTIYRIRNRGGAYTREALLPVRFVPMQDGSPQ